MLRRLAAAPGRRLLSTLLADHVPHIDLISPVNLLTKKASKQGKHQCHPVTVRNIYCIGRNYAEHAKELNNPVPKDEPVIFLKASSALRGLEPSPVAFADEQLHFECELVLLIGTHVPLGKLEPGQEAACVRAVGLGLDVTRRQKQTELKKQGYPWAVAKSFSGSAVVSPMSQVDSSFSLQDIAFELSVNGTRRQHGHVKQHIFDIPTLLSHINSIAPLLPGDLIFTGTPEGVGEIKPGDEFEMKYVSGPPGLKPFAGQL